MGSAFQCRCNTLLSGFRWLGSRIQQRLKPEHMPLGEPNFGRLAAEAQAQHRMVRAILAQCPMGLDLAEYVVRLNRAVLHLRTASRAHTEHISRIIDPASMGIRYQIQPLIVGFVVAPFEALLADLTLPVV